MATANGAGIAAPREGRVMLSLAVPPSIHQSLNLIAEDLGISTTQLQRIALGYFIAAADLSPDRAADAQAVADHIASVRPRASARYQHGWHRPATPLTTDG